MSDTLVPAASFFGLVSPDFSIINRVRLTGRLKMSSCRLRSVVVAALYTSSTLQLVAANPFLHTRKCLSSA